MEVGGARVGGLRLGLFWGRGLGAVIILGEGHVLLGLGGLGWAGV